MRARVRVRVSDGYFKVLCCVVMSCHALSVSCHASSRLLLSFLALSCLDVCCLSLGLSLGLVLVMSCHVMSCDAM